MEDVRYAIQINAGPESQALVETGFQFIKAALSEGHRVERVFFFGDGVYNAFPPPTDGPCPPRPDWSSLAMLGAVDLVLCVAALERRGLSGASERKGFRRGGLGLWMEACLAADRVLQFGA